MDDQTLQGQAVAILNFRDYRVSETSGWNSPFYDMYSGALEVCKEKGVALKEYLLCSFSSTQACFDAIKADGCLGTICLPPKGIYAEFDADLSGHFIVAIGSFIRDARIPRVMNSNDRNYGDFIDKCLQCGYKNVLICIDQSLYSPNYEAFNKRLDECHKLNLFECAYDSNRLDCRDKVKDHILRLNPEVVIGDDREIYHCITGDMNYSIPAQLAYVAFVCFEEDFFTGWVAPTKKLGQSSAEMLLAKIKQKEPFGFRLNEVTRVSPHWSEGKTFHLEE